MLLAAATFGMGLGLGQAHPDAASEPAPTVTVTETVTAEPEPAEEAPAEASEATEEAPIDLTSRGTYVLKVGEPAEVFADDKMLASLTVNSITVDPQCTGSYIRPPANGHFVVMDVIVKTGNHNDFTSLSYVPSVSLRTGGFHFITPEGRKIDGNQLIGNTYGCLPDGQEVPNSLEIGEQASGKLIFDVPTAKGSIVMPELGATPPNIKGWEWAVPAAK